MICIWINKNKVSCPSEWKKSKKQLPFPPCKADSHSSRIFSTINLIRSLLVVTLASYSLDLFVYISNMEKWNRNLKESCHLKKMWFIYHFYLMGWCSIGRDDSCLLVVVFLFVYKRQLIYRIFEILPRGKV